MFTSFGQHTAESYDKHILLNVLCIFWPEFVMKPRYFALHLTENGKLFLIKKHCPSPLLMYEIVLTVLVAR